MKAPLTAMLRTDKKGQGQNQGDQEETDTKFR